MVARIELVLDVLDLDRMVEFYIAFLGYERHGTAGQYASLMPQGGQDGLKLIFQRVDEPKLVKNRLHLDVRIEDIEAEARRVEALGARRVRLYEEIGETWILMSDPEGNEFCICQA